ncbi:flagellar biosynthesis anti-sigma factor FlgM [Pseudomonas typographi]|uniref:flagellar biosynthesis anti-sigma factor FlgM n=1 Tax=Pseudomonas typographi TaxID=2715964 RepID=UPI001684CE90|nr:flagellar biosynthesis anti-sigma factor FlgM [Pseudomonas typographi]MBD1550650.1 flagellar biosynthesis anti-sigma factor FlgM [Pseudomonas typographi]MBD1586765.1 flagellar biosynthesis anti-sigma factor FlgM [Pseudomonas typographi]
MVIDFNRVNGGTTPVTGTTGTSNTRTTEAASTDTSVSKSSAAGDTVHLSDSAQFLQKVSSDLQSQPVVDSAKVAEIKEKIANGSYNVDPTKTAGNILKFEADR